MARSRPTKQHRLEERLSGALRSILDTPEQVTIRVVLFGAKGFYRTRHADVQAWTGHISVGLFDSRYDIGSWDTMTECLRGFEILDRRNDARAYADFEVVRVS